MNISFIALNISGAETVQSAADNVRGILSSYGRCDFKICGSMSQVSSSLTDAFSNADLIAIGVEPSVYCKSKLAILHAMHIKTEICTSIKKQIGSESGLDSQQLASHCAMPVGAQVFPSPDGMFSGFAIKSGKQHFVLLPLDKLRLDSVMAKGLVPYFDVCGISAQKTDSRENTAENCIANAAQTLRNNGLKIYYAATPSCAIIKNLCGDTPVDDVFIFGNYTAKRGTEAPRSYIADLARYSIPEEENALGAAISNVFTGTSQETGEQKYNIYVAVADRNVSRVLRFASQPGETPEELVNASIEMLMEMICDKCGGLPQTQSDERPFENEPIEMIEEEPEEIVSKKKHRGLRVVIYTLLALIAGLAVLFGIYGYRNAQQNAKEAQTQFAEYAGVAVDSGSPVIALEEFEITVDTDKWTSRPAKNDEETAATEETKETEKQDSATTLSQGSTKTTAPAVTIKSTTTASTTKKPTTAATTKKPTTAATTKKPTTAATTKKPTTTAATTKKPATTQEPTGSFVFTTYGYGHGVGMSQEGAMLYSKQGTTYSSILLHYYPGTNIVKSDTAQPETVKFGGVSYPLIQYLCCSVQAEIGSITNTELLEAIKAQTVAIYTYAKRYSFSVNSSLHAFNKNYAYSGTLIEKGVKAVLGQYLAYNGKPAMTMFYAMSAGKTTTASTVWGGTTYPYLEKRVDSPLDKTCKNYKVTYTISAKEIKQLMKANIGVDLSGDPHDWFTIIEHDDAVSSSIGYVNKMTVGGKSISGAAFRNTAMNYRLRSHCFTVKYVEG